MFREEIPRWASRFLEAGDEMRGQITTCVAFQRRLASLISEADCPIVRIEVTCTFGGRQILAVEVGQDASDVGDPHCLDHSIGPDGTVVALKCSYWVARGGTIRFDHIKPVVSLFEAYLALEVRREGMLILDAKRHLVLNALKAAVEAYVPRPETHGLALVYLDLDKFKIINDTVDHATGDLALRDVEAQIMESAKSIDLVGFVKGGDEYVLLFPEADDFLILSTLNSLRQRIRERTYGPPKLQIDFTAGVARPRNGISPTLDDLLKRAEDATKEPGQIEGTKGDKKRGTVSFDSNHCSNVAAMGETTFIQLGAALIRAGCQHPKPFANQALNFISHEVFVAASNQGGPNGNLGSIHPVVTPLLSWLGAKITDSVEEHHLIGAACFDASVPSLGVGLAIAHGVLRASSPVPGVTQTNPLSLELQIPSTPDTPSCLRDSLSGTVLWGETSEGAQWLGIGGKIASNGDGGQFVPLVLVLEIGLTHKLVTASGNALPEEMFGGIVVVDDRPRSGGGLPDFWQAAIANLAAEYLKNVSTVRRIVVLGDDSLAPETVQRLTGNKATNAEELGALADCTADQIRTFLQWTKLSIKYANDAAALTEILYDSALELDTLPKRLPEPPKPQSKRMKRLFAKDSLILPISEGLYCKTPIEAYPAVLDCLRHPENAVLTWDDASQKMHEVLGFKLLVESPDGNAIPDYWYGEKKSLDDYAQDVLIAPNSLIGKHFSDGQFEQFVTHLSGYFVQGKRNASTRRAILTVPNPVGGLKESGPKPLGLVSVWATPRHTSGQSELTFCFVWRTVEALVGFPYSFYGSVKFAEHVISAINTKLQKDPRQVSRVSLGPLRYLALSLHMRIDDYHRSFAKRIVDAASD